MNKFGYIRGRRGPKGPPGKNAFEIHKWCPDSMLRMFRENEDCTFFFNTAEDGIIYNEEIPIGLKDRFGKNNGICLQGFHKPVKVDKVYGIPFKNSLYKVPGVDMAIGKPSICVIAFAFKPISTSNENDFIFTNGTGTRAVTISSRSLNIWGIESPLDLEYHRDDWNRMILQYSRITDDGTDDKCFFILNGRRGFFKPRVHKHVEESELFLGGHPERKNFANVVIVNFEVYFKIFDDTPDSASSYIIPTEITELLNDDMEERIAE